MREDHTVRGSLRLQAGAAWYAAELAQRTGRIADAENEARLALDLTPDDVNLFTGGAIEILVWALAERGAFAEAHALLDEHGLADDLGGQIWEIGILHSRAVLALAEGDFPRAHDQAVHAGRLRIGQGRPNPVWTPWRATAALALAHQGRQDEAAALAAEELALAERFGAPAAILTATHAAAVAEADDARRLELCETALARVGEPGSVLELSRIRLELGHALSRLGRRVEARRSLQLALADADRTGATLLAERARRELVATGLRPRRAQTEGVASLTPRQRQVCELAASGNSEPRDRPAAVPERQDGGDPPRRRLREARRRNSRSAPRRAAHARTRASLSSPACLTRAAELRRARSSQQPKHDQPRLLIDPSSSGARHGLRHSPGTHYTPEVSGFSDTPTIGDGP